MRKTHRIAGSAFIGVFLSAVLIAPYLLGWAWHKDEEIARVAEEEGISTSGCMISGLQTSGPTTRNQIVEMLRMLVAVPVASAEERE